MSDLQDLHETYQDRGVRVFALNVPAFGENQQTVTAIQEQAGLTYPVLNHQGTISLLDFAGSNGFPYPRDAIIDQDGVIVYTNKNYDAGTTRAIIDGLLAD